MIPAFCTQLSAVVQQLADSCHHKQHVLKSASKLRLRPRNSVFWAGNMRRCAPRKHQWRETEGIFGPLIFPCVTHLSSLISFSFLTFYMLALHAFIYHTYIHSWAGGRIDRYLFSPIITPTLFMFGIIKLHHIWLCIFCDI